MKAAKVLLRLASLNELPLRIVLGSDAYNTAQKTDLAKLELTNKRKEISCSTAFSKQENI